MEYDENEEEDEELMNEKGSSPSAKDTNKEKMATPNLQPKAPGTKQRRRSKNDCFGRDYVCGCGKTYLSYPALYTHIKTKHNGKTPEGTNANQVQSGRGRGRPRKNFLLNEDQLARKKRESNRHEVSLEERNPELKELLFKNNINNDSDRENEDNYFFIYGTFGLLNELNSSVNGTNGNNGNGNSNDSVDNNNQYSAYPSPVDLFPIDETKGMQGYEELRTQIELLYKTMNDDDDNASITHRKDITCDLAFAIFIIELSRIVTASFYKMIIILLKHYRDCMNRLGWEILAQHKYLINEDCKRDYCSVKDPSRLPEIANDFINEYLPFHLPKYDRYFAVIIISHFNFWLFKNNHTNINLKLKN